MTKNDIQLSFASLNEYPVIQNMARFYAYDMSEYMENEVGWEMPEDGLYACIDFKKYWETQESFPFLIRYQGELAGFVIIDKLGSDEQVEFNMAQFFIVRKFKRKGIGKWVACHCFDRFKGVWEVMVMPGNTGAYQFWKKVISQYTNHDFTEYKRNIKHFNNSEKNIFRFTSIKN
jgi:[ribosomal protein S5]-alanine N-acetyltransferase